MKRILVSSIVVIALCLAVVSGATFALFTDSVESNVAVNSGTVDIAAYVKAGSLTTYSLDVIQDENVTKGDFENTGTAELKNTNVVVERMTPGDKIKYTLDIENNSNVSIAYRIKMVITGSNPLADNLEGYITTNSGLTLEAGNGFTAWTILPYDVAAGKGEDATVDVYAELPLEAGNDCQDEDADITFYVEAVQANGTEYITLADFVKGGEVVVNDNVTFEKATIIDKASDINLNGKTVSSFNGSTTSAEEYSTFTVAADTTIYGGTVTSNVGYAVSLKDTSAAVVNGVLEGATLTIDGGEYSGYTTVINVVKGTLLIKGGSFKDLENSAAQYENGHYLINCIDSNYRNGTAVVVITGGSFCNWNPDNNESEGANTDFVPDGYTVETSVDAEGNTWYTVVPV